MHQLMQNLLGNALKFHRADVPPVVRLSAEGQRLIRWPRHYSMICRQMPEAEYVALEGLGHLAMWDDPEVVVRTILEVTAPEQVAEMAVA